MSKHHHHHEDPECNKIRRCLDRCCHNDNDVGDLDEYKPHFSKEQAAKVAHCLGINFKCAGYDLEQFRFGMDVELEHGSRSPLTNITNNDPLMSGKIALAHLNEFPDYYKRLARMEREAEIYWKNRKGPGR